jgi:hypothetical protein
MPLQITGGSIANIANRQTWKGGGFRDFWFDTAPAPTPAQRVVNPASVSEVQLDDRVYDRESDGVNVTDFLWPITIPPDRKTSENITRTSSAPAVVSPDGSDSSKWNWASNGAATITISCASRTVQSAVTASTVAVAPVDTFKRFATGSTRRHIIDALDGALIGKTPAEAMAIFTTQNHASGIYVRNAQCWANYADLTPISPWNSEAGNLWAGILISPRHVLFCAHASISTGATMRFIRADNAVVERTLVGIETLPGYTPHYPDLRVGVLNSDVPAGIGYARVLPENWPTKLPSLSAAFPLPALCLDQEEKAIVSDLTLLINMALFDRPTNSQRALFYEEKIGGDSGNPAALIINGQLVVLTCWTFGGAGSGTSVVYHKAAINSVMTSLGGGYQLTDADLSAFNTY